MLLEVAFTSSQYSDATLSPRSHKVPIGVSCEESVDSDIPSYLRSTSYPVTGQPTLPGLTSPSRADRYMCNASVDPTPSRISAPNRRFHRSTVLGDNGSAADIDSRKEGTLIVLFFSATSNIIAKKVGTEKSSVALTRSASVKTVFGVGRSDIKTLVAPAN